MKKDFIIIILFFFLPFLIDNGFAQNAPPIQWQNTIGGSNDDNLYSIQQTTDGGYIFGGNSNSDSSGEKTENSNGDYDYWIVKTDSLGNIQWQNTIGGNHRDYLYSSQQTVDGGYILGGQSNSDSSGDKTEQGNGSDDYWIVKTDLLGNIQWQNTIGGSNGEWLQEIQQTTDGGFILGGYSTSNISGDKTENSNGFYDYWIVKTDSVGNILWQNTIGGNNDDYLYSIQETADRGYILGGWSKSNISGDKTENNWDTAQVTWDYWIVKTDSLGSIQWQNTIGGSKNENLMSIRQTKDHDYILGGFSNSNISGDKDENNWDTLCVPFCTYDYWILKIDSLGNIWWQNTIGGRNNDVFTSIQQTDDEGYIFGGYSNSTMSGDKTDYGNGSWDYWIIKTDSVGNIQWQNAIGGSFLDWPFATQQTADGGYILGGFSNSNISGDKLENNFDPTAQTDDYWIVKLSPDTVTGITAFSPKGGGVAIKPNPFNEELTITCNQLTAQSEIKMYDVFGRIILMKSLSTLTFKLQTSNLLPGIYFVEVLTAQGRVVKKAVKE